MFIKKIAESLFLSAYKLVKGLYLLKKYYVLGD
ncbi:MAG: hypothetical protein ACI965_002140 [Paraglaciecola sp.]|jgi:hypothetical protein